MNDNAPKKSIIKNSALNILYKGFTAIFPLLTSIYVARALLPDNLGKVTYANTVVSYFTLLASLGIPNYGIKAIAQTHGDDHKRSKTFSELFFINLLSNVLFIVLYYIIVNVLPYFSSRRLLFNVMGLLLILNIFNIDWLYQGMEEYGIIAARGTIVKIASLVAVIIFVNAPDDYIVYAFILCMATAGNYIFNMIKSRRYVKLTLKELNISRHLKPVFILLASSIATEIYTMLDTVMIEYFYGDANVAYYSNAMRIVRMTYLIEIALVSTFYPRISYYLKNADYESSNHLLSQGLELILLVSIPSAIGMELLSEPIILVLFGDAYFDSIAVLRILSVLLVIFSVAYLLGHLVLMASGKEKYILYASSTGAVINFILNSILIPRYMQNGAAIASVIAELLVTIVLIYFSRRYFSLKIRANFFVSFVVALVAMSVTVVALYSVLRMGVVSLCIIVVAAVVVYALVLILLRNDMVTGLLKIVRRKN